MPKVTTIDTQYIEENTFSSSDAMVYFAIELPSGFCERIPHATSLKHARQLATKRHIGRKWQHGENFKQGRYI
jgi:hypothetical protein